MPDTEMPKRGRLKALKNIPPVLRLVWDSSPRLVSAGIGLRILSGLVPLGILAVTQRIIDILETHAVMHAKNPAVGFPSGIWPLVVAEFALAVGGNVFGRAIDYCDSRLGEEFTRDVTLRVMRHAASLDLQSFEDPDFYDKLERARVQGGDRVGMIHSMGQLLLQTVTLVSLSIGVIQFSPLLFAILVVCVVPAFAGESYFALAGYTVAFGLTPNRRELDYLRVISTSKESAKEIKLFGLGGPFHERYAKISRNVISRTRDVARRRLGWGAALGIISALGYYGGYGYLVFETALGALTIGRLTFLAGSIAGASTQLQSMFSLFSSIADQALYLTDMLDFFAVKPHIVSKPGAIPAPRPIRQGFEFRDVCFQYPGSERLVLNHLNFRIEPGERVALVGENGQGKTTFVKLMARLYEPTSGAILLDGVDLREYQIEDLQKEVGIIFQDFVRYDMTARMNVGVGRIEGTRDDAALWSAVRKARAENLMERLPKGLDQMLGRRFEGGVDLSGGEWQKFALARAYLRDAQVLILDEPTAALDAVAEYEVFARFAELTAGRIAILISHRFSTVRMSDRIVVLEHGRIREQGTHDQLVATGGQYARLFELQAANYR